MAGLDYDYFPGLDGANIIVDSSLLARKECMDDAASSIGSVIDITGLCSDVCCARDKAVKAALQIRMFGVSKSLNGARYDTPETDRCLRMAITHTKDLVTAVDLCREAKVSCPAAVKSKRARDKLVRYKTLRDLAETKSRRQALTALVVVAVVVGGVVGWLG